MRLLLQAFYIKKAPSPHKVKESRIPLTKHIKLRQMNNDSRSDIPCRQSLFPAVFYFHNTSFG